MLDCLTDTFQIATLAANKNLVRSFVASGGSEIELQRATDLLCCFVNDRTESKVARMDHFEVAQHTECCAGEAEVDHCNSPVDAAVGHLVSH